MAGAPLPLWVSRTQVIFAVLIAVELVARVVMSGRQFVKGPDGSWNLFDVALVMTSVVEHSVEFFDLSFARLLRALRMLRVVRLFRIFQTLTALRLLVALVVSSFSAVVWVFVFLGMFIYMAAIFFMQVLRSHMEHCRSDELWVDRMEQCIPDNPWLDEVEQYYSTVGETFISLLAAVSGGVDWLDVASPLREVGLLHLFMFAFFIAFVTLGLLNIITSIFVESAKLLYEVDSDLVIQEQLRQSQSYANQLTRILTSGGTCDANMITRRKLETHLGDKRVKGHLAALGVDKTDVLGVFDLLQVNNAEEVNVDEMIIALLRMQGTAKAVDMATLIYTNKRNTQRLDVHMANLEDKFGRLEDRLRSLLSKFASFIATVSRGGRRASSPRFHPTSKHLESTLSPMEPSSPRVPATPGQ